MIILLFIGLFCLVFFDARFLKKRDEAAFKETIKHNEAAWAVFTILFFIGAIPVYAVRRSRFKKALRQKVETDQSFNTSLPNSTTSLVLMSDALGIIIHWFLGIMLLSLFFRLMSILVPEVDSGLGSLIFTSLFSFLLMIILIFCATEEYPDQGFFSRAGLQRGKQPFVKIFFVSLIVGLGFAYIASTIIMTRQVQPPTPLSQVIETTASSLLILLFISVAVLVAPLCEEIIFRGYFFHVIKKFKSQRVAIYIVALTFAFLHVGQYWGDWTAICIVTILGFALTLLRVWSGTTFASIITHYAYNGGIVVLPMIILFLSNPSFVEYQLQYPNLSTEKKEELLLKSINDQPEFADAYNDLAWLYSQQETKLDKALELIEMALAIDSERSAFLDTKAEILYKRGDLWEAIEIGERLHERDTSNKYFFDQLKKFKQATVRQKKKEIQAK